ncbi:TPA: hypothetical protein ACKP2Y_003455 [Pseudomonas putida]
MDKDEKPSKAPDSDDPVSNSLGTLYAVSVYQARATLTLAKALEADPATSSEVKEAAKTSLHIIDAIIQALEAAVGNEELTKAIKKGAGLSDE